ncbi:MAG: GatB/YqeY domain-containing protein [Clostridia bacterium]|nr:GatB/YqeY domain-containing protein [Clostridia bacterium]
MSLKDVLLSDMKAAMKDKDVLRKNAIQMVRAAILQIEKDKQITLEDDAIIEVIAKEVKKRKDSIVDFEKGGRQDLIDAANAEIAALAGYLPAQLSEEEIKELVKEAISATAASSMKDMGKVMAYIMPKTKGKADGSVVNGIVKSLLS